MTAAATRGEKKSMCAGQCGSDADLEYIRGRYFRGARPFPLHNPNTRFQKLTMAFRIRPVNAADAVRTPHEAEDDIRTPQVAEDSSCSDDSGSGQAIRPSQPGKAEHPPGPVGRGRILSTGGVMAAPPASASMTYNRPIPGRQLPVLVSPSATKMIKTTKKRDRTTSSDEDEGSSDSSSSSDDSSDSNNDGHNDAPSSRKKSSMGNQKTPPRSAARSAFSLPGKGKTATPTSASKAAVQAAPTSASKAAPQAAPTSASKARAQAAPTSASKAPSSSSKKRSAADVPATGVVEFPAMNSPSDDEGSDTEYDEPWKTALDARARLSEARAQVPVYSIPPAAPLAEVRIAVATARHSLPPTIPVISQACGVADLSKVAMPALVPGAVELHGTGVSASGSASAGGRDIACLHPDKRRHVREAVLRALKLKLHNPGHTAQFYAIAVDNCVAFFHNGGNKGEKGRVSGFLQFDDGTGAPAEPPTPAYAVHVRKDSMVLVRGPWVHDRCPEPRREVVLPLLSANGLRLLAWWMVTVNSRLAPVAGPAKGKPSEGRRKDLAHPDFATDRNVKAVVMLCGMRLASATGVAGPSAPEQALKECKAIVQAYTELVAQYRVGANRVLRAGLTNWKLFKEKETVKAQQVMKKRTEKKRARELDRRRLQMASGSRHVLSSRVAAADDGDGDGGAHAASRDKRRRVSDIQEDAADAMRSKSGIIMATALLQPSIVTALVRDPKAGDRGTLFLTKSNVHDFMKTHRQRKMLDHAQCRLRHLQTSVMHLKDRTVDLLVFDGNEVVTDAVLGAGVAPVPGKAHGSGVPRIPHHHRRA